ncbi:MAG: biopolymer transporter ExbD [Deltaproteobacteria bacterium]|nr:biopolymer transporter ExbD [Deltaproteobacteria bacterium]
MRIRSFENGRKKARIEIIPMIDTIFFLLVFFMIATLSMTVMRGIPVNIPKSAAARENIKDNVTVTLSKDGEIYYDKTKAGLPELRGLLARDSSANPDLLAVLNADEDVPHGRVVSVIDEIKLAGISRFAIATRPKR